MEFTLVATIPTHLLPLCSSALGRNSWEPVVQGVAVVLMGMIFLAVVIAAYAEARRLVFLSHPEMQLLQMRKEEQGTPVFDLNSIAGVKKNKVPVREEPTLGSRRPKKEAREAKEASPVTSDKTSSSSYITGADSTSNLQTNNNIKNIAGTTARQDANLNRSRNTKAELPMRNQPNSVESTETQARKSSSPLVEPSDSFTRRLNSQIKDSGKSKNSPESRVRNSQDTVLESASRRLNETKRFDQRTTDEGDKFDARNKTSSFGAAEAEVTSPTPSSRYEFAPKESVKARESSKETKWKQKKKTKVISRKGEKDQRPKNKASPVVKDREDDGALSDDSCSDGSSDKSVPEVRIQQPAKDAKGPRRRSLPSDASLSDLAEGQNVREPVFRAATTESIDTRKEKGKTRKNQTSPDGAGSKTKKSENQSQSSNARPKCLDVSLSKGQTGGQPNKNQNSSNINSPDSGKPNELRAPGPTSPHAIAAAVMSLALGKSMQAFSTENNFDDQEKTNKAYTKSSALSPTLSDSPPPMSSTSLSGSSRSSSYSSIVSSDGSNGVEQIKLPGMKGNKIRVKSTKSAPMEGRASPPWSSRGSSGSRKSFKPMDDLGLSTLRRGRWGMSFDSAPRPVPPRSPVGQRPEVLSSQYLPSTRPSLLEHPPRARGVPKKQNREVSDKVRPFDLNDLGLSDNSAVRRRNYQTGHPSIWKSSQENCYENPESLFSAPSRVADEHFSARNMRRSNNWVNFLDASNATGGVATSNKSMAEIWDAGNSPLDSDGWSVYKPVPPSSTSGSTLSSEANAVDALFSHLPAEWSSAPPESPFSTQEITWTPPPDVPSIWGGGYLGCSNSESLPTPSSASFISFPVQPQQEANQGPLPSTCTFEPLGTLGSSIWNPSTATPAWSPPSE